MVKIIRVVFMVSVMTVLVTCLSIFLGGNYVVYNLIGVSMKPTYSDGDIVVLDTTKEISRGDVIIFKFESEEPEYNGTYVKRVVGMPGDKLSSDKDFNLKVNDKVYTNEVTKDNVKIVVDKTVEVSDNSYYVVGDNEDSSLDSRVFGEVDKDMIVGIATPIHIKGK